MNWIKVTPETMPDSMKPVLVSATSLSYGQMFVSLAMYGKCDDVWYHMDLFGFAPMPNSICVTHWMPIPDAQKED